MAHPSIRVIAICLFHNNGSILVAEGIDSVKNERFANDRYVTMTASSINAKVADVGDDLLSLFFRDLFNVVGGSPGNY